MSISHRPAVLRDDGTTTVDVRTILRRLDAESNGGIYVTQHKRATAPYGTLAAMAGLAMLLLLLILWMVPRINAVTYNAPQFMLPSTTITPSPTPMPNILPTHAE